MNVFIYNPESGNGRLKQHRDYILGRLKEKYGPIEVFETSRAGEAREKAAQVGENAEFLFVGGGDGTLNEVINGLKEVQNRPVIGYIPAGTVNDVAHSLCIPKSIKKAVNIIVNGTPFEHDIFRVNDNYGIYVCCTGLFTSSSYDTRRKDKKAFGKIAYFFKGAKDLKKAKPVKVKLVTEAGEKELSASLILILNSRSTAGFMLNRGALLDDGKVELLILRAHEKKLWLSDILRCCNAFLFGVKAIIKQKNVYYEKLSHFSLELDEGVSINMDGEKSGTGSFNFSVIEKGIKILVSNKFLKIIAKNRKKD